MRVAFFHELQPGGARRSVVEFGKQLKKFHTVDLYYVDSRKNTTEEKEFTKSFFYRFVSQKWSGKNWKVKLYKDTIELFKLYRLHQKIGTQINKNQYDFVFFEPSRFTQAPFLLRFIKTKKLYYCQEALRMVYDPLLNKTCDMSFSRRTYEKINRLLRKLIDKQNILCADVIFSNSLFSKNNIKKAYDLRSTVCYMGVDTNVFNPVKTKKDIDILYVGAYDFVDGYDLFEKAIRLCKTELHIKILARERQWIKDDLQLRDLYNRAKITVCISYNEPFGLIPLESMACETPVIALHEGGYKESITHRKTGILVKNDPKQLAQAIQNLLKSDPLRTRMGKQGREDMLTHWKWSDSAKQIERYGQEKK